MIDRFNFRSAACALVLGSLALTATAQTMEPQPAQPMQPSQPAPVQPPAAQPAPPAASAVDEDRASVQLAFTRADADGDGKLSPQEAARMPAVAARFADLDRDKDGFISNEEFAAAVRIQH